jgi:DNA polymerase-3 subunit delta'
LVNDSTWPVVGHDWAVALLRSSLSAGRIAHAFLLSGLPQIGKTTLAITLAQALNCTEPAAPCGQCRSCRKIAGGVHPDVRLITSEGASGSIKIEQIRALQHQAMLAPYEGRYRVFIVLQMEQATLEAANSLLKTLEEPPAQVVMILTAIHSRSLPRTVVSRCQCLELRPIATPLIETTLRGRGVTPAQAQLLARLSGGRLGWAIQAVENAEFLRQRQQILDQLVSLLKAGRVARLDYAYQVSSDPASARRLIELWTGWWRDLLLLHVQGGDALMNVDRLDELKSQSEQVTRSQSLAILHALQAAAAQLDANVNARLAMEGLVLQLPRFRQPVGHA